MLVLGLPAVAFAEDPQPLGEGAIALANEVRDLPVSSTVRLLLLLTALTFLPAMVLVMTPFTRFVVVFAVLRQAMGLQQSPPNQVMVGLALFLSLLLMQPTLDQVKEDALSPFMAGEMEAGDALEKGMVPMRKFMLRNVRRTDLAAVLKMGRSGRPDTLEEISTPTIVSAFVLSELKTALTIAVKVYLPFLVIDIVVANVLLAMGMMVLPPVVISLPFKLLLFVLVDGWNLLVQSMAAGMGV
ncbi:MAG: flagellar type III secretion system pore protein FliP [Myxococcota bacterium]|nr:flagellar type III secretion system pore protein FliP [Myxococcota bacterium]